MRLSCARDARSLLDSHKFSSCIYFTGRLDHDPNIQRRLARAIGWLGGRGLASRPSVGQGFGGSAGRGGGGDPGEGCARTQRG